ncbi:SMC domain protein [Methanococcus vannielii SB]|uniref:DNA double-strand break repair Rad50 ATPase n=1 Tax=Methanococcus vannielii (strain ATCC 35089 / DSM 1224 / JCM 13029 / OCM 148 / SB) TaxID=406327 RepID=A6UPY6_METVS|nr:AAA family ATPase [Methanococcus vannielii]ABR54558.1 SMC domain protein [Methanococcus vannielii SB]
MIIKSIKIENFKSHRNTKLQLNKGITTIIGHNGSGKSSIFQAMNFALFSPRGANFKIDNMMQKGSKSFSIELEFEIRGNSYLVKRKRYQNKTEDKLYINGILNVESSSEVNKKIEEILELDNSIFSNAVYIKQGEIANLIQMTSGDRKEVIGKLLGIERYEKVYEKINIIKKAYEERLFEINGELKQEIEVTNLLEKLNLEILRLETLKKEINNEIINLENIKVEKNNELTEFNQKFIKITKLREDLQENISEIKNISLELQNLENSLKSVDYESLKLENNQENYFKYLKVESRIKELSEKIKSHKLEYDAFQKLKLKEESLSMEILEIGKKINEYSFQESFKDLNLNEVQILKNINNKDLKSHSIEDLKKYLVILNEEILKLDFIKEKISELEFVEKQILEINNQKKLKKEFEIDSKNYDIAVEKISELNLKKNQYANSLKEKIELEKRLNIENNEKMQLNKSLKEFMDIELKINLEKNTKDKYDQICEKISKLTEVIAGNEIVLKNSLVSKAELEKTVDECNICKSKITNDKKQELLLAYELEQENLEKVIESLKNQVEILNRKKEILNSELKIINGLKPKYGELLEKKNSILKVENSINELELKLTDMKKNLCEYEVIKSELSNYELQKSRLKEINNKYQYCIQFLNNIDENNVLTTQSELLKVIGDYDVLKIQLMKKDLETLKDNLKEILQNLEREKVLNFELTNVKNNIYSKLGLVEQYLEWETEKSNLEVELSMHKKYYEEFMESMAVLKSHSKAYSIEITKLNDYLREKTFEKYSVLTKKNTLRNKLINDIQEINYNEERHKELNIYFENILKELHEFSKKFERISSELTVKKENSESLNKKIKELALKKEEKQKIESFKEYLEKIRREVFSKDGFQKYLREKYIPLIQRHANQIFQEFELPYSHIQLKEDYSLIVDGLPVETLSGGEQIAVSLALRLGISKAVCNNIECIILDEPTAYLDEERRKNLLNIFRNIKTISQMAIITHHQELEQIADNILTVRKIGEISKVTLE